MELTYDEGREHLAELVRTYSRTPSDRNEAMTRLQLIDRLFFECLGWSKDCDVHVEESQDRQFADYVFSAPRRLLIVEAKREDISFDLPVGDKRLVQSLKTLLRDHPALKPAIEQVQRYCASRGVPFAAVANGHQIVAFVGARIDGVPWDDGKALVLVSLEEMQVHFLDLWNALSKRGVELQVLQTVLVGDVPPALPPKLSSTIAGYPVLKRRNSIQADLQIVTDIVVEDLVGARDLEEEFLRQCYIPSGSTSDYALLSKRILEARYAAMFEPNKSAPSVVPAVTKKGLSPDILAASLSRRPILLLGDVGVGKSIFIRRLIKVEAKDHFTKRAIALYLDLGTKATLTPDLRSFMVNEIVNQLWEDYGIDIHEAGLVRGIYASDLKKFAKGIWGEIRDSDPSCYKQKELEFLESKLVERELHLRLALDFIGKTRPVQIVLFVDNVDQRSEQFQQDVFLIAQELAENWPLVVYVTLRPETFNKSKQFGALSGYAAKAFTIAPPRVDRVLEKRMEFALKLTSGSVALSVLPEGTSVDLGRLESLIRVFLHSLKENPDLGECIENVSSGNIRVALELVKTFFSSGHVYTEKILSHYSQQGSYTIPIHEFLRAVIYGDFAQFYPETSLFVNLFDVESDSPLEHFLMLCALAVFSVPANADVGDGFVSIDRVYDCLQRLENTPRQIDRVLIRLSRKGLIESSGRRIPQGDTQFPAAFRITSLGAYHLRRVCHHFSYFDAVVVDTPIFSPSVRDQINNVEEISQRLDRGVVFWHYLSSVWASFPVPDPPIDFSLVLDELKRDMERIARQLKHEIKWS